MKQTQFVSKQSGGVKQFGELLYICRVLAHSQKKRPRTSSQSDVSIYLK